MFGTCFGRGKIKIGVFGKKGFEIRSFFSSELISVRLSEPSTSSKRAVSEALSERECRFWTKFAWSSCKRAPSERAQNATGNWSRKRTRLCLSEQHPVLATSLCVVGDQSELSKLFLLTCLIIAYVFNHIGISFESNWT